MRNLALASIVHSDTHKFFPTGGWGYMWGGDPDRGYDKRQPAGWGYNILPYIEERVLHDLGTSGNASSFTQQKKDASRIRIKTVIALYLCPTRGRSGLSTNNQKVTVNVDYTGSDVVAKTDYAINGGSVAISIPGGPAIGALAAADSTLDASFSAAQLNCDGVSHIRSQVRVKNIIDGTSKTYLIGEKYLNAMRSSDTVMSGDDNQSWEAGLDWDTYRWTASPPLFDQNPDSTSNSTFFGSSHAMGFNMGFCDGNVRHIPYDIENSVHTALGGRRDGVTIGAAGSMIPGV
ncbi:MAG: DUF1559 domain-containing protein [Pirellulales bacterium]